VPPSLHASFNICMRRDISEVPLKSKKRVTRSAPTTEKQLFNLPAPTTEKQLFNLPARYNITQESFNNGQLVLTMNAPTSGNGSATICTGNREKPDEVRGATNWSYDDNTGILTVDFSYSRAQILVSSIVVGIGVCTVASLIILRKNRNSKGH